MKLCKKTASALWHEPYLITIWSKAVAGVICAYVKFLWKSRLSGAKDSCGKGYRSIPMLRISLFYQPGVG